MGKRTIKLNILKALLVRSGNQCAFLGCEHPIFNDDNLFIAQLCHIKAISPGGPRYNPDQTDNQRNDYSNLLFMCYRHHKETDDEDKYSVATLQDIKGRHEERYIERPFDFDVSMVFQVKEEMRRYWIDIQRINSDDTTGLRMEVDKDASFTDLVDEINSLIDWICDALEGITKEDKELYGTTISFLKKLGYDTQKIQESKYNENPLINRNWELNNIGWPNWINKTRLRLKQMEIKYYEEYLIRRPDDKEIKQRLEEGKREFKHMSKTFGYSD